MPTYVPALFYILVYCVLAYIVHWSILLNDRHEGNPSMSRWISFSLALLWPLSVLVGAIILVVVGTDRIRGDH